MIDRTGKRIEQRRKGPDIWVKLIHWLGVSGWLLMGVVIFITDKARPEMATFFDRVLNIQLRTTWDMGLIHFAFFLMAIIFCLCAIGLLINSRRHQRKGDRYSLSLIIMAGLSALGILLYFIHFGGNIGK